MGTDHHHRICTFEEAEKAIRLHETIYVNDCFCRGPAKEGKTPWKYCGHPVETCMGFAKIEGDNPIPSKEITLEDALNRFESWKKLGNFFRFMEDENWVCFCCACGCGWFRDEKGERKQDPCGKSPMIEKTNADACVLCEACVDVCSFGARSIVDESIRVDSSLCYGCSACEYTCPEDAITMVPREV